MDKTIFIAELGINAHGNPEKMLRMILKAVNSGATLIKGQYYDPVKVLGRRHPEFAYATQCQFSQPQHETFAKYAESIGGKYFVSVFNIADVQWASQFGFMKVATRMNKRQDFIRAVEKTKLPVFMSVQPELCVKKEYSKRFNLLWCVAKYPTPKEEVLSYPYHGFGLSSHCPDPSASLEAWQKGARVLENHLCESKGELGCDIPASIDFEDYKALIKACH